MLEISKPEWIPCITSFVSHKDPKVLEQNSRHLISVSPKLSLIKARDLTIIDCRTYGLMRNKDIDPVKHYYWYIDFVRDFVRESNIVFIPPDADWLSKEIDSHNFLYFTNTKF